jgi:hypothetical protein
MPTNDVIDELIAACDGNVHGALKALLLVNERLETELQYFYELVTNLPPDLQGGADTMR